jgi:hypothetical protein
MILGLENVAAVSPDDLRKRLSKDGRAAARGEFVDLLHFAVQLPLANLADGEKLHIVASGDGERLAGLNPDQLLETLRSLGLSSNAHVKQIHLIADDTGRGGRSSFAGRLADSIARTNLRVDEIKAPAGKVRCESDGKIWILRDSEEQWLPSCPALNYYDGPRVQTNHVNLSWPDRKDLMPGVPIFHHLSGEGSAHMYKSARDRPSPFADNLQLPAHNGYPRFNPLVYSLENDLPLLKLGFDDKWAPDQNYHAKDPIISYENLRWTRVLVVLLGWF